jgi:hypothetical protein
LRLAISDFGRWTSASLHPVGRGVVISLLSAIRWTAVDLARRWRGWGARHRPGAAGQRACDLSGAGCGALMMCC